MKTWLLINPAAGSGRHGANLQRAVDFLVEGGWEIQTIQVDALEISAVARQAAEKGVEIVLIGGGDGSAGLAAGGVANSDTRLGILPIGTGNVFARDIGLPVPVPFLSAPILEAAKALYRGHTHRIDLGHISAEKGDIAPRYFLSWAGIGLDAEVAKKVESAPEDKRLFGRAAYVVPALTVVSTYQGVPISVQIDEHEVTHDALWVTVNNIQLYGGLIRMAPTAHIDDGWLDVTIFPGRNLADLLGQIVPLAVSGEPDGTLTIMRRGKRVRIEATPPLWVHADSDPYAQTPVCVKIVPRALNLILPEKTPNHLLLHKSAEAN